MTRTVALAAATVAAGLMAGLFASFAYAVMPGLRQSDDRTFVAAMQNINVAILNGWFLLIFLGALVLGGLSVVLHWRAGSVLPWVIAGVVFYLLTLAVTFAANVPLNDKLAAAGSLDPAAIRAQFEGAWIRWNIVRTVTSLAAFVSLVVALVRE